MSKRNLCIRAVFLAALVLITVSLNLLSQDVVFSKLTEDQQKTLDSIELVDEYPSYTMTFFGDFGIGQLLKTGKYHSYIYDIETVGNCSTIAALNTEGDVLFGRNLDWTEEVGTNVVFTDSPDGYATITVAHLSYYESYYESGSLEDKFYFLMSPYSVYDGMNECGLAISHMQNLDEDPAGAQDDPDKFTFGGGTIMRIVLERAANVDEALELLKLYNHSRSHRTRYLISDASGDSAVVEYYDQKPAVTRNSHPWQVATNVRIYQQTQEQIRSRCFRYPIAYDSLAALNGKVTSQEMLDIVESISVNIPGGSKTEWSTLYNLTTGEVKFVVNRKFATPYIYQLPMTNDLSLSKAKVKRTNLKAGKKGVVTFKVENQSVRKSPETKAKVYLYKKKNFEPLELGEVKIPSLTSGKSKTLKAKFRLPRDTSPGIYKIKVEVVNSGGFKDYKPENNLTISKNKLRVTG